MTAPLADALKVAEEFQHEHGCEFCTTNPCEVYAPGDWTAHDRHWRANNVTSRRPNGDTLDRVNTERGKLARKAVGPLARALLALHAEATAMRAVVDALDKFKHAHCDGFTTCVQTDDHAAECETSKAEAALHETWRQYTTDPRNTCRHTKETP